MKRIIQLEYMATVIKAVWCRDRHISQWKRIEKPEKSLEKYAQWLIFKKGAKPCQWRNNSLYDKWCWNNWQKIIIVK